MENILTLSYNTKIEKSSEIIPDKKIKTVIINKCSKFQNV